jgi:uncharacterized protein (TIGR03435 family)
MIRGISYISVVAILSGAAFGQSLDATLTMPKFEVADVHVSPRSTQPFLRGPFSSGNLYEMRFATMVDLVSTAYGITADRVSGGPNWLELDRFDVKAKFPAGSTPESKKLMLQSLLADRFNLVVRSDTKPMPVYSLTAGKHQQLKEADGSGETGCKFTVENNGPPARDPAGGPSVIKVPVLLYTCQNETLAAFAEGMRAMPAVQQYLTNGPVVDATELKGSWDFSFKYTPKIPAGIPVVGENIPIFDALDKLGLHLAPGTIPMPVTVVASVNEKPTDNPPDVAKNFPPVPTEFDVAEIKLSDPVPAGGRGGGRGPEIKNGQVYLPGMTLGNLISIAWNLNGPDTLVGAPKWLDSDRFDIIAKAPSGMMLGTLTQETQSMPFDVDTIRPMIRALIIDRFKLKVHNEDRPMPAYTLTAVKPKLNKADPAGRTKWHEGPASESKDQKNPNATLGRLVTCQNMTMAQFADLLPSIAPGYIRNEVVDATGLEGNWDFTFSFSPAGVLQLGGGGRGGDAPQPAGGTGPAASDPSGGLSLFDAVSKQLGLKLEMQKRPKPVMVIDSVLQKPTDN